MLRYSATRARESRRNAHILLSTGLPLSLCVTAITV